MKAAELPVHGTDGDDGRPARRSPRATQRPAARLFGATLLAAGLVAGGLSGGSAVSAKAPARPASTSPAMLAGGVAHPVADLGVDLKAGNVRLAQTAPLTVTVGSTEPSNGAGTLFGLAIAPDGGFYYVDDGANALYKVAASGQATLGIASISPQAGSKVNGVAILKLDPTGDKIDVTVDVAGLAPNTIHPAHIHSGTTCSANGPILYPFPSLKADAAGVAHETLTIPVSSVPATGWYVNVHMGPDLVGAHATPIGCGVVSRGL